MSTLTEGTAAVGWYPDGADPSVLRWWDGNSWTDHVRDNSVDVQPDQAPQVTTAGTSEPGWWDVSRRAAPVQSSTDGVWALSFTPWIAALAWVGAVLVYSRAPGQTGLLAAAAVFPMVWAIVAAVQDRSRLVRMGFVRPPTAWWIVLGPLAYAIARTIRIVRDTGGGRAPLTVLLLNTAAVPAAAFVAVQLLPGVLLPF